MKASTDKIAALLFGSPGSGKGTQAKLLADRLGLFHFDSGDFLRRMIYDPKLAKNKTIQREKKLNESGKLQTPSFVLKAVGNRTKEIIALEQGIVFSGSPRTFYEAFGQGKNAGLIEILSRGYGRNNLFIFTFEISEKESAKRNSDRFSCPVCKTPLLTIRGLKFKTCPFCGSPVIRRRDDNPEVIKTRMKEYRERTFPIFAELKRRGYKITKIDASPAPYKIHKRILSVLTK